MEIPTGQTLATVRYIMTEKLTFKQMQDKIQTEKNNSDLLNLAQALERVRMTRKSLDAQEAEIMRVAALIESGEVVPVHEVKFAYNWQNFEKNL